MQVLRAKWLRRFANTQAYHDVTRFATEDAMLAGRLHTFMPGSFSNTCSQEQLRKVSDGPQASSS